MAFLSGLIRRLLGGLDSRLDFLEERGVKIVLLVLLYAPIVWFGSYGTCLESLLPKWLFVLLTVALVIIAELKGHFPGFMCGTESQEYIDEQVAKGRKIPYEKLVDWFGKIRGYEKWSREWCFWQLVLCKTVWCIPVSLFVGSQFIFAGLCVAFAYNAMFWVGMKNFKNILCSPTNWGEFWQGVLFCYALY